MHMHNAYDDSHSSLPTTPASRTFLHPESPLFMKGLELNFGTYSAVDTQLRSVIPVLSVCC